jgi:hypothetical protein
MRTRPHQRIFMFLDKRHFPGTLFDRVTPLSTKDEVSPCRPNTAKTAGEFRLYTPDSVPCLDERGENLVHWLSKFGHRCPNLASVVHSWPVLATFGQSCPNGVIVHPSGGPPRTAISVEVRKFSAKIAPHAPLSASGRFRAADGADADLRKSAPRNMNGPRFATSGAG